MHLNSILETEEERFVKKKTISVIENVMREAFRPFSSPFHFHFLRSEYFCSSLLCQSTRVDIMGKEEEENISDDAQLIYRESMS